MLVVAYGEMAGTGVAVGRRLSDQGIGVTVVDPVWALPVNPALLELAREHELVISIEDNGVVGGCGARLAQELRFAGIRTPIREFGIAPEFLPHGNRAELLDELGLTPQAIARYAVEAIVADEPAAGRKPDRAALRARVDGSGKAGHALRQEPAPEHAFGHALAIEVRGDAAERRTASRAPRIRHRSMSIGAATTPSARSSPASSASASSARVRTSSAVWGPVADGQQGRGLLRHVRLPVGASSRRGPAAWPPPAPAGCPTPGTGRGNAACSVSVACSTIGRTDQLQQHERRHRQAERPQRRVGDRGRRALRRRPR